MTGIVFSHIHTNERGCDRALKNSLPNKRGRLLLLRFSQTCEL